MDRLRKALKENGLEWKIDNCVYDAGHDSAGNYEYLMDDEITPVIALTSPRRKSMDWATVRAGLIPTSWCDSI